MTAPSSSIPRRFSRGRDLGPAPRAFALGTLLAAGLFYGVATRDLAAGVFGILLMSPRRNPLFDMLRGLHPSVSASLLGLALLVPFAELPLAAVFRFPLPWWRVFAHLAMIVAVWKVHHLRIDGRDHYLLLAAGVFVVLMGTAGEVSALPLLCLYAASVVVDLVFLHLLLEEQRVLDLARVRGFDREVAEEVSGRGTILPSSMMTALSLLALGLVLGGLLLAWTTPYAAAGVRNAWNFVAGGEEEAEPLLPEAGDEIPPFAIPHGITGLYPFGRRLERDEFVRRVSDEAIAEALTLLARPAPGPGGSPVSGKLLLTGECYDYLDARGRWIRARARKFAVHDLADGQSDFTVRLRKGRPGVGIVFDYLVPPGPDRTLYAVSAADAVGLPTIVMDGVGNLMAPGARAPSGPYRVISGQASSLRQIEPEDVGPEFLLLPPDLSREELSAVVRERLGEAENAYDVALAVQGWLERQFIHLEGDTPPEVLPEAERPPDRIDVMGFLTARRWGSSMDFASAFAMLLRARGIPCRLATGYAEGDWLDEAGFWVFRARHAHAWVEIPFEGVGWVSFDATPALLDVDEEGLEDIFEAPPEERAEEAEKAKEEEGRPTLIRRILDRIDEFISSLLPGGATSTPLGRVLAWAILLAVASALLRLVFLVADKGQGFLRVRIGRSAGTPVIPFYERLLRVLARHGMRRRRSQTPVEFARKVVSVWGADFEDVRRLTSAFCRHRYGGIALSRAVAGDLMQRVLRLETLAKERAKERRRGGIMKALTTGATILLAVLPVAAQQPRDLVKKLGDADVGVRSDARRDLAAMGKAAIPVLLRVFRDEDPKVVSAKIEKLIRDLDSDDFETRENASRELRKVGPVARDRLREVAKEGSPEASRRALTILVFLDRQVPGYAFERKRGAKLRRVQAMRLLEPIAGGTEAHAVALAGLAFPELTRSARLVLAAIAGRDLGAVLALLDRPDRQLRLLVVQVLGVAGLEAARPRLLVLHEEGDRQLRAAVRRALVTSAVVEDTDRARALAVADPKKAEEALRDVLRRCPGYAEAGIVLLRLLERNGRYREALTMVEGLDLPDAEKNLQAARCLAALGDREAALARIRDGSGEVNGDIRSLVLAARILLGADPPRVATALEYADSALRQADSDPEVWALLGRIYGEFMEGEQVRAFSCYRHALVLDPDNASYRRAVRKYSGE